MRFPRYGFHGGLLMILAGAITLCSGRAAAEEMIVSYNPQNGWTTGQALPPSFVAPGITAGSLASVGLTSFISGWNFKPNPIAKSATLDTTRYQKLKITPTAPLCITELWWSKRSNGAGPRKAAVRSSLDNFASDVALAKSLAKTGDEFVALYLEGLPQITSAVELRIYFWDNPFDDAANLVSTAAGGQGLTLWASTADNEGDGIFDPCDADDDNDTWLDASDDCPLAANADQQDLDLDGEGDACDLDIDGDDVPNELDNCPDSSNGDQLDTDVDGLGDVCDDDIDGDGTINTSDVCQGTPAFEVVVPSTGCSIEQSCPCAGPFGQSVAWKNHGHYVSCVSNITSTLVSLGLLSQEESDIIVSAAAQSTCAPKNPHKE